MKRVRISNSSLNSYGTRVLTAGMSVDQYMKNPVLLYMHQRGSVIGYIKDLKVEGDEVTGEPVFDEATELSKTVKKQFEFGSIRMVSCGIDILEMSDDPAVLVQGQTSPTITKSKLCEVSIVDIGANDDAIVLRKGGQEITLGKDGVNPLPLISINPKSSEMEMKEIALKLGLSESATEAEVMSEIESLCAAKTENETLRQAKEQMQLAKITAMVEQAITENKLELTRKEKFIELGKKMGEADLQATLDAMAPRVQLSKEIGKENEEKGAEYSKLSEVPEAERATLRETDIELYRKLYAAEYGIECNF